MRCLNCGSRVSDEDRFCNQCGEFVQSPERVCRSCGRVIAPTATFCSGCGASQQMGMVSAPTAKRLSSTWHDFFTKFYLPFTAGTSFLAAVIMMIAPIAEFYIAMRWSVKVDNLGWLMFFEVFGWSAIGALSLVTRKKLIALEKSAIYWVTCLFVASGLLALVEMAFVTINQDGYHAWMSEIYRLAEYNIEFMYFYARVCGVLGLISSIVWIVLNYIYYKKRESWFTK